MMNTASVLMACLSFFAICGCESSAQMMQQSIPMPVETRGPRAITDWTLAQVRHDNIYSGIIALGRAGNSDDSSVQKEVVDGLLQIHNKLAAGWPGFNGTVGLDSPSSAGDLKSRQQGLISQCYSALSYLREPYARNNAYAKSAFLKIEPSNPDLHSEWLEFGRAAGFVQ